MSARTYTVTTSNFKTWLFDGLPTQYAQAINLTDITVYTDTSGLMGHVNLPYFSVTHDKSTANYLNACGCVHVHTKGRRRRSRYVYTAPHVLNSSIQRIYVFGRVQLGLMYPTTPFRVIKYYYNESTGLWHSYGAQWHLF